MADDTSLDKFEEATPAGIKPEAVKIQSGLAPGSAGRLNEWPSTWVSNDQKVAEEQAKFDKARQKP